MEVKCYQTMSKWFAMLSALVTEDPSRTWEAWEDARRFQLGCKSSDGIILAYGLAAFRKHYKILHFASIEKEQEAFTQYRQDVGIILNK